MWLSNPQGIAVNNLTPDSNNVPGAQWNLTNYNGISLSALSGSAHALTIGTTANSNRGFSAVDTATQIEQFSIRSNIFSSGGMHPCVDFQAGTGTSLRDLRLRPSGASNILINNTNDFSTYQGGHLVFDNNLNRNYGHLWMESTGELSFVTQNAYVANLGSDAPPGKLRIHTSANGTVRPSSPVAGQIFFDFNLATPRPIWCKNATGPIWVDSTGAVV
jgi:hypothetical protein